MERLQTGGWWKFDSYEIRDGYIRPTAGAKLTYYDPWESYGQADRQKSGTLSPHADLLHLVAKCRFVNRGDAPSVLTEDSAGEVLRWCGQYGLLGVLLQRVQMVTFPYFWAPAELLSGYLMPAYRRYCRVNWGWTSKLHRTVYGDTVFLQDQTQLRSPVPDDLLPRHTPPSGVLIQDLRSGEWDLESVDQTWASYFPDVPETARLHTPYPIPLSEAFWHTYAEPVTSFVDAAACLLDAVSSVAKMSDSHPKVGPTTFTDATDGLHTLLSPVAPGLQILGNGLGEKWISPSLLSTMAMMVFQDITGGRRVLKCAQCGSYFFSAAYQARYCTERCRFAGQKRTWRRKRTMDT